MNRCPITYEDCGRSAYSSQGLRSLSRYLKVLRPFPYSADEQRREAVARVARMSIQGVQPKLSVVLSVSKGVFEVTDVGGRYIVKPQNLSYSELPENEDLSLRLAQTAGIEVPFHGLIYSKDKSLSLFVKRFDRTGRRGKIHVEDFAQLAGKSRDTKYDYSMEKLVDILGYCTFPMVERLKLFRLTLFNYLIGNEDMHLKNFSLIRRGNLVELSPAYDLVNSTIILKEPHQIALPLRGKTRQISKRDLVDYFGGERLRLTAKSIDSVLTRFREVAPQWKRLASISFLSQPMRKQYLDVLEKRLTALEIRNP